MENDEQWMNRVRAMTLRDSKEEESNGWCVKDDDDTVQSNDGHDSKRVVDQPGLGADELV